MKRSDGTRIADLRGKGFSLIFFLPLSFLLATVVAGSDDYALLLVIAAIVFFSILTRFSIALTLIALTCYFLSFAIWKFALPRPLINLGYALIVMVMLREYFFTAGFLPVRTPINRVLFALLALAFLSIANGESSLYPSLKGLLRHFGFPLLFLLILLAEPEEKLMRQLVWGIIIVAFLQIPASAWQFFWYSVIAPKPPGMRADWSGGLLGESCGGYTAVFMAMIFCLLLAFILVKGFRLHLALGAGLLLLPIYLASARAGIPLFAAGALFMLIVAPLPHHAPLSNRLLIATLLIVGLVGLSLLGVGGSSFQAIFNPDYVYNYSIKQADAGMGRLQAFEVVSRELRTPLEKLIGRGPGILTPTSIVANPNSLIARNSALFRSMTGYAYTTIELGYFGLLLFLLLHIQVYRFIRRFLKQIDDPFWEAVSLGCCGVTFIYVISIFYVDSWIYYPLPFTFWALAAALYRVGTIRQILAV